MSKTYDEIDHRSPHKENVLVLFDLDGTLVDSPISLHSGPWITYYWQTAPALLPEKMDVIEELMWHISKSIPLHPVDPATASLIALLQQNKAKIPLVLTARPPYQKRIDGIKVTFDQLNAIGIDFSQTERPIAFEQHPFFYDGMMFTKGKMKGDFLKQFLASTGYCPRRIIFIDDNKEQILSVEKAMQDIGVPVDCIWYRHVCLNSRAFEPQIANIQLEHLLKYRVILSDEEAFLLLDDYASITPNEFLKQLIEMYDTL